ncbi:MAG: ribonuclease III [Tannerellaceae bacterium]|nr:ribonuclease III [Tannerellaceae bacterium]
MTGVFPGDISVYSQAFRHRSSSPRGKVASGKCLDNERLEFLGDAILGAIVADMLYKRYPDKREGFLTDTRSKIVRRETMHHIALALGIDRMMCVSGVRLSAHNNHTCGNALEALIAAIYLDRGYRACSRFVRGVIIGKYIDLEDLVQEETNFKSMLIEWAQKRKESVSFKVKHVGCDDEGSFIFRSAVFLGDRQLGIGTGYSKKESQQKAAEDALRCLRSETKAPSNAQ